MVMAKDRHRLQRLRHGKHADAERYQALLQQSQQQVEQRRASVPPVTLNAELPVSQYADRLVSAIVQHQVIIVAGETGSGKTTQLPQIALLAGRGVTGMIGHTQPRRLAARSVSQRIAEELKQPLGQTVSYKVRFNEQGSANSLIRLMTDGILLAELAHDRFLTKYDTIIIDEAHERSLNIDFILGYIKQILPKRPDLKVIVTSATLDVTRFSRYFNHAPIFEVEGRSYPVEVVYRPISEMSISGSDDDEFDEFEDLLPRAVVQAVEECYANADAKGQSQHADILIFASTEQEIRELEQTLHKHGPRHTEILPLFARLGLAEQQKIFQPSGKGRRIIIATNVAETALTVPNIRYVIDSGFARISRYNYRSRVQRLPIEAISQAAANQRKGRCGRIAPGVCIRLYSEDDFLSRPAFTEPEIKRTNLASVILQMQYLGLGALENFDFIEPPDYRLVNDGRKLLIELGAYNEQKDQLTKTGIMMAKMPIDPRLSRMLIGGAHFGALAEALIIVSALSVQDPRERPADKQMQADQKHALFREGESDFLFYLNLWHTLQGQSKTAEGEVRHAQPMSENQRRQFARQHFLSWLRLREWRQTHQQLAEMCAQLNLSLNEKPASYENLHRALLSGLLSFVAQKTDERNIYQAVRQQKARIFPSSVLHKSNTPWLMAFEIVETSQVFIRTLAKIEPEWILLAARDLLKYHYYEPHWSKKAGVVQAYAQISLFGLIIQPKQLVNFEKIDPVAAREIFIRDALVTGQIGISPPFLQHNLAKLQEIERIEDKLRRRDLIVDEELLFQFYDQRVPPEIASKRSFEDWRATVEPKQPKFLYFSEEDIWQNAKPTTQQFPDYWLNGQLKLAVEYHFDPSHDEDGARVTIPVEAISQINTNQWSWGIIGWRDSLIEALLKNLPKDKRRELVPIPSTVQQITTQLNQAQHHALLQQHIFAALAFLLRGYGITEADFSWEGVAQYLRPYAKVIDGRKRVIAQGRDISELQARCREQVKRPIQQTSQQLFEFPADFEASRTQLVNKVNVAHFQALVPVTPFQALDMQHPTGVVIQQFHDMAQARLAHREGLIQLIAFKLGDLTRQLKKQIDKSLLLAFSPLGSKPQLENMLIYATLQVALTEQVQHAAEFNGVLHEVKRSFLTTGQHVLSVLRDIFITWQAIRRLMLEIDGEIFGRSIDDIEDQLDLMQLEQFVYQVDSQIWLEYPRYLAALQQRLERLPHNIQRDQAGIDTIDEWMDKLFQYPREATQAIYPMVEELRISLFAQPMKTKFAISAKRLHNAWQALGLPPRDKA